LVKLTDGGHNALLQSLQSLPLLSLLAVATL
jgi:hypothetical protein